MSHFTSAVVPSVTTVRTFGKLHGSPIAEGARSAKSIAAEIAASPQSKSAQSLAAEEVNRALARVAGHKRGISKFERVLDELEKLNPSLDLLALARAGGANV